MDALTFGGQLGKYDADLETRFADMDIEGVSIAVLFPSVGLSIGHIKDPKRAVELCQQYNDWMAQICGRSRGRLKAMALLAPQNATDSVKELRRAIEQLGAVGGLLPTIAHGKLFGSQEFFPLYEVAEELNYPLATHANAYQGESMGGDRFTRYIDIHTVGHPFEQMMQVTSIIFAGVLERFRKLRLGIMESGCGWVPFFMDRMDEEWEVRGAEAPAVKVPPSEYFRSGRLFFSCDADDKGIPYFVEKMGDDVLMYSSDYPHFDMKHPRSVTILRERTDLSGTTKEKLLSDNARSFYRL